MKKPLFKARLLIKNVTNKSAQVTQYVACVPGGRVTAIIKNVMPLLLFMLQFVLHATAQAEIYKWVDEQGKSHASDELSFGVL